MTQSTLKALVLMLMGSLVIVGCGDEDDNGGGDSGGISASAATSTDIGVAQTLTITGLDDAKAYRVTLVVAGNVTADDGSGVFVDNDGNGAADAGASEDVARIVAVNGTDQAGAKTVPGGDDDPANPSGVTPSGGQITLSVVGIGAGTVYPVVYENGGASTFLEIDANGVPTETYAVGGAFTVNTPTGIAVGPTGPVSIDVDGTMKYTISGLDDAQAYRITLVVAENVTTDGAMGVFMDGDANGAADAGASEDRALIVSVNGTEQTGAKTVPGGDDDPADPSGVNPVGGLITLTIQGVGAGTVYPVVYENGGASTFLEIGSDGVPTETYFVAGDLTVN